LTAFKLAKSNIRREIKGSPSSLSVGWRRSRSLGSSALGNRLDLFQVLVIPLAFLQRSKRTSQSNLEIEQENALGWLLDFFNHRQDAAFRSDAVLQSLEDSRTGSERGDKSR
jgi:hypothetical protein